MYPLYPDIRPYARHRLAVDDVHELYIDESGDPHGIPVLFVHGGPGSGCEFDSRRFFDPDKYRIILFDQRGAGRSTPRGEIADNTTAHLVEDMEKLRRFLGIEHWVLFGGGWGATLSLVYAQAHPERVTGMILRGTFLGRRQDIDWFCRDGAPRVFPDHYQELLDHLRPAGHEGPIDALNERIHGNDELARMSAIRHWSLWEAHCSTLRPDARLLAHFGNPQRAISRTRVGAHYLANDCFLEPDQILRDMAGIAHLPGTIVHGRFDMVSPLGAALELSRTWPAAQLYIVREAGHSATEAPIIDALVRATRDMVRQVQPDSA